MEGLVVYFSVGDLWLYLCPEADGGQWGDAAYNYEDIAAEIPQAQKIAEDEERHEQKLLAILDEERLQYVGSMVLGLNDALVELTGTLAGLTLALQNTKLIALSGLITGVSATLSMASSEFLSARSEGREDAFKSCVYTGIAYCITVALLVLPILFLMTSIICTLGHDADDCGSDNPGVYLLYFGRQGPGF